ncbi:MAG: STAS domain-containing protein [Desulfobacterales bacterium]|nr:STAS domain-containing protein [Desulfobacterales bacterium]
MVKRIFPFLEWFRGYTLEHFRIDAIAGLTVALVLIPQSMAYAQLAGLPPYYGLYAAFLPPMVAALFGSSRQLATGPVAVVSLMTSASLEPLATAGSDAFIAYAVVLALTVGVFQLALGLLRLGLVVNFLSHPVVNGFTNAAAIIIASSQLSKLFGVYVDKATHHYETILRVCHAAYQYTHWPTLLMGALAFGIMYGLRRLNPKIPNVLVAVAVTTVLSWSMGFRHDASVDISAIDVPQAAERIEKFNAAVMQIPALSDQRTTIAKDLERARLDKDVIGIIDAEHDLAVINANIDRAKHEAHIFRTQLRGMFFSGKKAGDGAMHFMAKETVPADSDGRLWRIAVGNNPIDPARVSMTGGGAVVGTIPKGLPSFTIPPLTLKTFMQLLPYAIIISLLGFMEAISIAKAMAAKTGQRLDPNQELVGQGLANILGSVGKSYPVSGSFSRSAVNLQAGAVTGLSSVFTSVAVLIVLLFFTPLLFHLPQAVLAAVIMMAVIGLVNVAGFVHAWEAQWYDGVISVITFLCTLAFAPHLDKGIMVGVALSLMLFLYKSMRPTVASLSRTADDSFRCSITHGLGECRHVDLVRFDGPLFFANASYLEDKINERLVEKKSLRHIIIAANGISDMDASGEETLSLLIDRVRSAGVDVSFSGLNDAVMAVLKRTHLLEKIGADHLFPTMERAVCLVHEHSHHGSEENECPLTTVCRIATEDAS